MYLCVCKAVSERTARRAVREQGIVSLRELSRHLGVGTGCGKCVPAARELLGTELPPMQSGVMPAAQASKASAAA